LSAATTPALVRVTLVRVMMYSNIFYTSEKLTLERFTWITELLKLYCTRHYPESLHHHPRTPVPGFSLFLSNDACYCLVDHRLSKLWDILFRLPHVRFIFDSRDLLTRGISIEPFSRRSPDQIVCAGSGTSGTGSSFAEILLKATQQETKDRCLGFLQCASPYLNTSPSTIIDLFHAAVGKKISPELYGFLDGVYLMHHDQRPTMTVNAGDMLLKVNEAAQKKGLSPLFLVCSRSAASRGFATFTGNKGKVISSCTIPPARIWDISQIASRLCRIHPVLSHSACAIQLPRNLKVPEIRSPGHSDHPSLVVLVTHPPYGNEMAFGALTFALACSHLGIFTRVVFMEDGIYSLSGHHKLSDTDPVLNIQSVITATNGTGNLEYYAYTPSFRERGLSGSPACKGVQMVDPAMLSQIFFKAPGGILTDYQRVLLF